MSDNRSVVAASEPAQNILAAMEKLRRSRDDDPLSRWEREVTSDSRDWANAYIRNGMLELENVKSLVNDILTGPSDVWAKGQLLTAIADADWNFRKAMQ